MQGCKKSETTPIATDQTNLPPAFPPIETATNAPTNEVPTPPTNVAVEPTPAPTPAPQPPVVAEPSKEYVITKGDSFSTIAKKTGVSVKAISDANPGVNSTKLQVGQKLQIPAGGNTAAPGYVTPLPPGTNGAKTP
jgi:LysM repeat protein